MAVPNVQVRITAQNQTGAAFQSLESSLTRIRNVFRSLGVVISAAAVGQFLRKSIDESAEAEAALTRLRVAVQNAGGDFGKLEPQVTAAVEALQRMTRFEDDQARSALATMVTLTGNFSGSLKNLGLAADVAVKTQKPLAEAAQIVGLAMDGNVRALRRLGIQVKDSKTALEELRATYHGFAEQDGKTFQGRLAQLSNAYHNLQEAIGDVLTGQNQLGGALPQITAAIDRLTAAIKRNQDAISRTMGGITTAFILGWKLIVNVVDSAVAGIGDAVAELVIFIETAMNESLIRPLNDFLALIRAPFQVPELNTAHAQSLHAEMTARVTRNWEDIKTAIGDAALALLGFGEVAKKVGGGGGGGGGDVGAAGGVAAKVFENVASRGAGNTVAGGGLGGTRPTLPDILGGARSPGGPNTNGPSPWREWRQQQAAEAAAAFQQLRDQLAVDLGSALGDGIANGFAAAFGKGGIKAGFKALAQTMLAGLGNAMVQFGKAALIASTLMQRIKEHLASLNPLAGVAASLALIAVGGLLAGAAQSAFGGNSSSGYSSRGYTDTVTRVTVPQTPASQSAGSLTPLPPIHFTVIGTNDPRAQREIGEMVRKAVARNV